MRPAEEAIPGTFLLLDENCVHEVDPVYWEQVSIFVKVHVVAASPIQRVQINHRERTEIGWLYVPRLWDWNWWVMLTLLPTIKLLVRQQCSWRGPTWI